MIYLFIFKHTNTPSILKPIGPSTAVSCISLVRAGAVLPEKALDRLLSLWWCQHVFSWAHHDNSLQAWVDSSCMNHTHIRGNVTLVVCVRLQLALEIPFYGRFHSHRVCRCVCVCAEILRLCVKRELCCTLWGYHMFLDASRPCQWVPVCVFTCYLWLIPAITGSKAGVNRLPQDHLMDCRTPAPVGSHSLWREMVMKHST